MDPIQCSTEIAAVYRVSADELWRTVDFHQPSENIMPPIAESHLEGHGLGATKVNHLAEGGGEVHLLLVYYAPDQHAFNYTIQSSPLPVKDYVGEVRVEDPGGGRARLTWRGTYAPDGVSPEQANEVMAGFYESIARRVGEIHTMEALETSGR